MKIFRLVLIGLGALVALLLIAVVVAFNSSFQTWAARKALAQQPALHATIGSLSAGLKHVAVREVRVEQNGVVLTLPTLEADLPLVSAGLSRNVAISRLVARGWTLDLSHQAAATVLTPAVAATASGPKTPPAGAPPNSPAASVAQAFVGIFRQLQLPVDLSLDGVELEGDVILPQMRGRAKIGLNGGGLGAGREGKFALRGDAILTDKDVNALTLRATATAAMDTPRTFTRLAAKLDASAHGAQFPQGVELTADLATARTPSGETYSAAVTSGDRSLLTVSSDFPAAAKTLAGIWTLDVRDADLAPFSLGHALPAFTAAGEGKFDTDASFTALHASGKLAATADRLNVLRPELSSLGAMKLAADFDLAQRGSAVTVDRLNVTVAGAQPILAVQSLQSFTFDLQTRRLQAADATRDLLGVTLQGLPLAWAQPFLKDLAVTGGDARGELVVATRSGGVMLRTKTPLTIGGLTVAQGGKPLLRAVDLSLNTTADYAPEAWQAEITALSAKSGAATLLTLDAKVGQLTPVAKSGQPAPADEPIKATGKLSADLAALLAQPAAEGMLALTRGEAAVDFAANIAAKKEVQATITLKNLTADAKVTSEKLPAISTDLRADFAPNGVIALHVPIVIERDNRKSDLAFAGTLTPAKTAQDKLTLDAQVTSANFVVDDARVLAALLPAGHPPAAGAPEPAPDNTPPWAAVEGTVELALQKVVYSDSFQASEVKGKLRVENGALKVDGLQAGLGEGGDAKIDGAVTYDPKAPKPYALTGDLAVHEFDPGPLLRALNPNQPPTIEGKFDVTSKLLGGAATLAGLGQAAAGDFQLTSKGGSFRALATALPIKPQAQSALGVIGGLISSAVDRNSASGTAMNLLLEITKALAEIQFDQITVTASRDPQQSIQLKTFNLISPDVRLSGTGQISYAPGRPIMQQTLDMQFTLGARGRLGELMNQAKLLKPEQDSLGYTAFSVPVKIGGTVAKTDTSDFQRKLLQLGLEKSGLADKASDLFNRLLPGGK